MSSGSATATSLLLTAFALSACTTSNRADFRVTEQQWEALSLAEKQAALSQLSANCGLPPSTLTLLSANDVTMRPPAASTYKSVECLLRKLEPMGSFVRLGFVGNEAYAKDQ